MSGPYPPGYPPPEQGGWWAGGNDRNGQFSGPQYGVPNTGWGEPPQPPRPPRSTGRLVVAVVSVLVIVGGVVTGIVLLNNKHSRPEAAAGTSTPVSAPAATAAGGGLSEAPDQPTGLADPGVPNGRTDLQLTDGTCVTAEVDDDQDYTATGTADCGSPRSDLILVVSTADLSGCADHQYLRLSAPSAGVYCFTLDIEQGDCVDENYLKTPCSDADFQVLSTETGPGGDESCTTSPGATHWVPIGRDPVRVGCLGTPSS
ncbi:MAG TPA: hypothetical protein VHV49_18970 [Pseudonocardiaceae bacterium]|jgi:hypothetical protein|nr:hypothetical protein [Pseudonocardiaceae bacterium]